MTIEERLDNLERNLAAARSTIRRMLATSAILAVAACLFILVPHQTVSAHTFRCTAAGGAASARLSADDGALGLYLYDEKNVPRAGFVATKDGPMMGMNDETGLLVGMVVTKDGPKLGRRSETGEVVWRNIPQ